VNGGSQGCGAAAISDQSTSTPGGPTATAKPPTATPKPKAWVTVNHFEGKANSTKTFDVFHLKNGDHLVWRTTTRSSANLFMADHYKKGQSYGNDLPFMQITSTANGDSQSDSITVQNNDEDVYLWVQADSVTWV
jgi:hypothetical protein